MPVTWSDEKLILLYCPGRGSNSRPSTRRSINMIMVSYALTTRTRKGMLIRVQKPGKPTGPLTSLRPIVLLSVLRKTQSLIVLSRIAPNFDEYLSSSQSGFRRGRSTADVVFGYRWLCAKAQRHRVTVEFLGIDLSRLCL